MLKNNSEKTTTLEEIKNIEPEIIKIEIDAIPLPKTSQKLTCSTYLCLIIPFIRLSVVVLPIIIFLKVIQILEVVQTTNFCI